MAHEVVECQLYGGVFVAGEEIQWVDEVVEDGDGVEYDYGCGDWL